MSTRTLTAPQFRLAPRTRKAIVVLHVISSVAILGQVWVNAVLAVIAMRAPAIAGPRTRPGSIDARVEQLLEWPD